MFSIRLDTETRDRLIELVKPHPILYNELLRKSKSPVEYTRLWDDIARKLKLSGK